MSDVLIIDKGSINESRLFTVSPCVFYKTSKNENSKRKFVTGKNFNIYIVLENFIVTKSCHIWCLDVTE